MGLHLNIDNSLVPDNITREHRKRVWWTAYNFDRFWSCKIGLPVSIADEDISVDLPVELEGQDQFQEDLASIDTDHLVANVSVARLAGDIIKSIYSRNLHQKPFSQRVQNILKALQQWMEQLPAQLQLDSSRPPDNTGKPVSLHLAFNQVGTFRHHRHGMTYADCFTKLLILATRPVLLQVFGMNSVAGKDGAAVQLEVPASARAVADACIRSARHSCTLLTECWLNGSFHVYDFFYTQYLFSASTVLALSAMMNRRDESHDDLGGFTTATSFLDQLKCSGNFAAKEFHSHAQCIIDSVICPAAEDATTSDVSQVWSDGMMNSGLTLAGETALEESLLQNFITRDDLDFSFLDGVLLAEDQQDLYWPL